MGQNTLKSVALAGLILLSLIACSSVTPRGLIAASRLDPLNSDAAKLAVAVGVPNTVRLVDGDAEFALSFVPEDTQYAPVSETVSLQVRPSQDIVVEPNSTSETIYVAQFSPGDADRIAAAQARIKALKNNGIEGEGSLSIGVVGGCFTQETLTSLPVSTWLRTDPTASYVRLTRTQDMLAALPADEAAAIKTNLKACD